MWTVICESRLWNICCPRLFKRTVRKTIKLLLLNLLFSEETHLATTCGICMNCITSAVPRRVMTLWTPSAPWLQKSRWMEWKRCASTHMGTGMAERKGKIANCFFQIEIIGFKGLYFWGTVFVFVSFYLLHPKTLFTPARKLSHTWRNHPGFTFPRTFYYLCLLLLYLETEREKANKLSIWADTKCTRSCARTYQHRIIFASPSVRLQSCPSLRYFSTTGATWI